MQLFRAVNTYYATLPGSFGSVVWRLEGEAWMCEKAVVPSQAQTAEFADLPEGLREEVLALAARAEAIGGPEWGRAN